VKPPPKNLKVEVKDEAWGAVSANIFVGKRRVGKFVAEKERPTGRQALRAPRLAVRSAGMWPGYDRRGLGTKGYEALAKWACANGFMLASDQTLTDASRGFWEKQVRKGRAVLLDDELPPGRQYRVKRYVLVSCEGDLSELRRRR
jgi:hypothetical protein